MIRYSEGKTRENLITYALEMYEIKKKNAEALEEAFKKKNTESIEAKNVKSLISRIFERNNEGEFREKINQYIEEKEDGDILDDVYSFEEAKGLIASNIKTSFINGGKEVQFSNENIKQLVIDKVAESTTLILDEELNSIVDSALKMNSEVPTQNTAQNQVNAENPSKAEDKLTELPAKWKTLGENFTNLREMISKAKTQRESKSYNEFEAAIIACEEFVNGKVKAGGKVKLDDVQKELDEKGKNIVKCAKECVKEILGEYPINLKKIKSLDEKEIEKLKMISRVLVNDEKLKTVISLNEVTVEAENLKDLRREVAEASSKKDSIPYVRFEEAVRGVTNIAKQISIAQEKGDAIIRASDIKSKIAEKWIGDKNERDIVRLKDAVAAYKKGMEVVEQSANKYLEYKFKECNLISQDGNIVQENFRELPERDRMKLRLVNEYAKDKRLEEAFKKATANKDAKEIAEKTEALTEFRQKVSNAFSKKNNSTKYLQFEEAVRGITNIAKLISFAEKNGSGYINAKNVKPQIAENWFENKKNRGKVSLKDAVAAYNTGVSEVKRSAEDYIQYKFEARDVKRGQNGKLLKGEFEKLSERDKEKLKLVNEFAENKELEAAFNKEAGNYLEIAGGGPNL